MDTDLRTVELAANDPIPNASAYYWRHRCQDAEWRLDLLDQAWRHALADRMFRRVIIGGSILLIGYLAGVLLGGPV